MSPTLDVIADTPVTATELHRFCEQGRKLYHTAADLLVADAAELRWLLGKAAGNPWLVGIDSKIAARRVARHMVKAAAASDLAAREMQRTWFEFQANFLNTTRTPSGRRVFLVNR